MTYTTFNQNKFDATKEPMFFGESVNVARFDKQKHPIFEKLTEKALGFFWRPEEVDLSRDKNDFAKLSELEQHVFISNLKYQTLLDSVQGRSPNVALLPVVSLPELETWIETWSFYETIHSRSYTHIMRNVFTNPTEVLDGILDIPEIIERAGAVTQYYDNFIQMNIDKEAGKPVDMYEMKRALYLLLASVNILEGVRFYVSFACSFSFAERKMMEGNAKIIKLIARDEALHLTSTQHMLQIMAKGKDDPDYAAIAVECQPEVEQMFRDAVQQEKDWANYLFNGGSMIGMNAEILGQYVEFIAEQRANALGITGLFNVANNPLPWMNTWLNSDSVQVAPQETEISSYMVGAIDSAVDTEGFGDFDL